MDIVSTLGRLHPVVVHLPIGLFAGILVLEIAGVFARAKQPLRPAVTILWVTCVLVAGVTALCGWQLANEGGYAVRRLFLHRWLSVAFVVAALILTGLQFARSKRWAQPLYRNLLILSSGLLLFSGHLGGTLTHGRSYLTKYLSVPTPPAEAAATGSEVAPEDHEISPAVPASTSGPSISAPSTPTPTSTSASASASASIPSNPEPTIQFALHIQPLFDRSCLSCHGPDKRKGGLRLDSPAAVMAGGDSGTIFIPGKPRQSLLYTLVRLPPDDPDVMPQKGNPLTLVEQQVIHDWILQGAPFAPGIERTIAPAQPGQTPFAEPERTPLGPELAAVVEQLESRGVVVRTFPGSGGWLSLNFSHCHNDPSPPITLATDLAQRTAEILMADTTGAGKLLAHLHSFRYLTRLNLKDSDVSDSDLIQIGSLTTLKDLNLSGTQVTDAGLSELVNLNGLENLYLWNSRATPQGIRDLQNRMPHTRVTAAVLTLE